MLLHLQAWSRAKLSCFKFLSTSNQYCTPDIYGLRVRPHMWSVSEKLWTRTDVYPVPRWADCFLRTLWNTLKIRTAKQGEIFIRVTNQQSEQTTLWSSTKLLMKGQVKYLIKLISIHNIMRTSTECRSNNANCCRHAGYLWSESAD